MEFLVDSQPFSPSQWSKYFYVGVFPLWMADIPELQYKVLNFLNPNLLKVCVWFC
jgi:hypothetical protein